MPAISGRVVKWVEEKGHGILSREDGGANVMVKRSGCGGGSLVVGGQVTFGVREEGGQAAAFEVEGEGVCERGEQADAKIALRAAAQPHAGQTYVGVVVAWNDLIGSGIIRGKKFSVKVPRKSLSTGYSLVIGKDASFEVTSEMVGDLSVACNVAGDAVVDKGCLPDSQLPKLEGVKTGCVLKWSSESGQGLISWDGGEDIVVKSKEFALSVGTNVDYEIRQEDGDLVAVNVKGVGVTKLSAGQPARAVSSRLKSMKFMKRHDEIEEREKAIAVMRKAAEGSELLAKAETNNEIRVAVDDSMPVTYHALGRRRFGQVDPPKPKVNLAVQGGDPAKKSVRYHMSREDAFGEKDAKTKFFGDSKGGKGGKGSKGGKGGKGGKRGGDREGGKKRSGDEMERDGTKRRRQAPSAMLGIQT